MKLSISRFVFLVIFSPFAWGNTCGIPEKYLGGVTLLSYALSEIMDETKKKALDVGSLILTWNLQCDKSGEWDFKECKDRNCDSLCGAFRSIPAKGDKALIAALQLSKNRKKELLIVGWAATNDLDEGGLPKLKGKVYLQGYKVLNYDLSNNQTFCTDSLIE